MNMMRGLIDEIENSRLPTLGEILVPESERSEPGRLVEGKWISGRFDRNIRIDAATHLGGNGDPHAHVYGRHNDELVVVNLDGSGSHGTRGRLHQKDADALRARDFKIRDDRIVEWAVVPGGWATLIKEVWG